MAEASSSRVTITLGRSGRVVKKAGPVIGLPFPGSGPAVGSKRSVRDRLGTSADSAIEFNNKRQRGDGSRLSSSGIDDARLGKDDLRYKIMRRTVFNGSQSNCQQNGVDLRDFLSRPAQCSTAKPSSRQRIPEPRDNRPRVTEPRDDRQRMLDSRDSRQYLPEIRDSRQYIPEARDVRQHRPELKDVRYHTPESRSLSILGRAPSTRNENSLTLMDSLMDSIPKPYSPWTLERLRRRSPDGVLSSSRGISSPRRGEELQRRPPVTPYDDPRLSSYTRKDVSEFSRPVASAGYVSNSSQPAVPGKTVAQMRAPIPQSSSLVRKSSYAVADQPTVDSFLHSLGLDKYAINFKAEEVDLYSLKQMGDNDLKELGVPMGPRKKILLALAARARRQV